MQLVLSVNTQCTFLKSLKAFLHYFFDFCFFPHFSYLFFKKNNKRMYFYNIIKTHSKFTNKFVFLGDTLAAFSLKSGIKQKCLLTLLKIHIFFHEVLANIKRYDHKNKK